MEYHSIPDTLKPKRCHPIFTQALEMIHKKENSATTNKIALNLSKANVVANKISRFLRKLILNTLLWYILGALVPQLREVMPEFYHVVDGILLLINQLFKFIIYALGQMGISW